MRFFSNDARESNDDRDPADQDRDHGRDQDRDHGRDQDRDHGRDQDRDADDRTERVQSEPVSVPGQRPPSPWATPAPAEPTGGYDDDPDRTQYQPTGYGAVPVAGDRPAAGDVTQPVVTPAGSVEPPAPANTTTYPPENTPDEVDVALDDHGNPGEPAARSAKDLDRDPSADRDTAPDRGTVDDADAKRDEALKDEALKDDGGFEEPVAVDPATDEPLTNRDDARGQEAAPVVEKDEPVEEPALAPVPVAVGKTATAPAASDKAFFAASDAQGFQERWRDVQLRFVDSPKEAAAEAATLVDEAVDKLTASLRAHKDELAGEHDDTEALRVQLRGYRDVLNRILGL